MLVVLEHVGFGLEAFPAHGRQVVAEERIVGRGLADRVLHFLAALLQRLGRQHAHAHVECAPGRDRARPVAAGDLADVEVHRVVMVAEILVVDLERVPLLLQLAELLDDPVGGLDGVRAGIGLVDVDRMAGDLHLEPHHADLRHGERAA